MLWRVPRISIRQSPACSNKRKTNTIASRHIKRNNYSNSPVTDTVMSALNTLKLPDDIQQQIQEVRTGTSARAELEQQISYMESQKDIAENELMRQYLNDTTINGIDSIIAYLETQRDLINKKQTCSGISCCKSMRKSKNIA
jgi:cbb3-type cytochrome oxidase cytochrome c subunit